MRYIACLLVGIVVCGSVGCFTGQRQDKPEAVASGTDLCVYGSHRIDEALKKIIAAFETENNLKVSSELGCGVPQLIPDLKAKRDGDVLVAGEVEELKMAKEAGLVASSSTVASNPFVLVVKKGNPLGIKSPEDLKKPGIRLVLPTAGGGCVSRLADGIVNAWGLGEQAAKAQRSDKGCKSTVGAEMVATGEIDAVFTWRNIAAKVDGIEMVPIEKAKGAPCECFGIILTTARNQANAEKFVKYLQSEKAQAIFRDAGLLDKQEHSK